MRRILHLSQSLRPRIFPKHPRPPPRLQPLRRQHESGGHKWYFQDPPPPPRPIAIRFAAISFRVLRIFLTTFIAFLLGHISANYFTTWTWLHNVFTPGSEGDLLSQDLIKSYFASSPLVALLEKPQSGWILERDLTPDGLDKCLRGSRGVSTRYYRHPAKSIFIGLFHFGEGCEGDPSSWRAYTHPSQRSIGPAHTEASVQQTHRGLLASYIQNTVEVFAPTVFSIPRAMYDDHLTRGKSQLDAEAEQKLSDDQYWRATSFDITFDEGSLVQAWVAGGNTVTAGTIYAVVVVPATSLFQINTGLGVAVKTDTGTELQINTGHTRLPRQEWGDVQQNPLDLSEPDTMSRTLVASLMQIDHLPFEKPDPNGRSQRYARATAVFGRVEVPKSVVRKPFELSIDGQIT